MCFGLLEVGLVCIFDRLIFCFTVFTIFGIFGISGMFRVFVVFEFRPFVVFNLCLLLLIYCYDY